MFDPSFIRTLCAQLAKEQDTEKVQDLFSLLQSVVREDQEEARLRLPYLAEKYKPLFTDEDDKKIA